MLDFAVELGAEDEDVGRQVHPGQQCHDRSERTVGRAVIGDVRDIESEQQGEHEPGHRGEHRPRRDPLPPRIFPRRAEAVKRRRSRGRDQHQREVGQELAGKYRKYRRLRDEAAKRCCSGRRGKHKQGQDQRSDGHRQRGRIEPEQAAFLFFLIGDVQRGDDRAWSIGPAVKGNQEGNDQPEPLAALRALDRVHQLVCYERRHVPWEDRRQGAEVVDDRSRFSRQSVDEHDHRQQRKQREESVEGDTGRDEADIVIPRPLPGPAGDVFPRSPRHPPRRTRLMALRIGNATALSAWHG